MAADLVRLSKFLSLVLRHKPEKIGIALDANGWVAVDELLATAEKAGVALTPESLRQVCAPQSRRHVHLSPDEETAVKHQRA